MERVGFQERRFFLKVALVGEGTFIREATTVLLKLSLLTLFRPVDFTILIIWMSPFVDLGVSGEYCHLYNTLHSNSCKQTV